MLRCTRFRAPFLVVAAALTLLGAVSPAPRLVHADPACMAVPNAGVSTVPRTLPMCPLGDIEYVSTVRAWCPGFTAPISGSTVTIGLSACAAFDACSPATGESYSALSGANGEVRFRLAGGGAAASCASIDADGVDFGALRIASVDQDGDLAVDADDALIVQGKIGTGDLTADFNQDGAVTLADVDVVNAHMNHSCNGILDAGTNGAAALAIEGVRPNPARGPNFTVRLAIPSASNASLELFDVSGRRVIAREVGSLGPGRHEVSLAAGHALKAGVYLIRLTQGATIRTATAVVVE